jgi:transcriptional regulator of acetoin/glycerol metabolism
MDTGIADYIRTARARGFGSNIIASWERSTQAGVHPYQEKLAPLISDPEYRKRFDQNGELVELFEFFIRRFAGALDQLGACSLVCDDMGYILSRVGRAKILSDFDRASLREGANCSEAVIGTNAPGLALVTREPVVVTADEHYSRQYHTAFCVASPILDENRRLLGCVDITKFLDRFISEDLKKDLLGLAVSVSDAIRNEITLRKLSRSFPVVARQVQRGDGATAPLDGPAGARASTIVAPLDASRMTFGDIVGRSPRLAEVVRLARSYSQKDANVLLQGETGTGKEMLARAIHNEGKRARGLFVAVNCAAIPLELAESELFGYERGAFTGARADGQCGKFESAHEGTLFLDEVDSMPLPVQAKILRAVETKRVSRINGRREIAVDVRIIAAANRRLTEEVLAGRFRKDLFYRLNVLRLVIPSLRDMREDVPSILDAFLSAFAAELGTGMKVLGDEARARLVAYDWPGNVRELRNCVEYLYNTVEGETILLRHLPPEITDAIAPAPAPAAAAASQDTGPRPERFESLERQFLVDTMRRLGGDPVDVAKALGVSRATIYRKLKKHGLT